MGTFNVHRWLGVVAADVVENLLDGGSVGKVELAAGVAGLILEASDQSIG